MTAGPVAVSALAFDLPAALGLELAGYAGSPRRASTVHRPLEGAVLRAVDAAGGEAFLVSLDLLFAGPVLTARIRTALAPAAVVLFASHTHSAPATDPGKPGLGAWDARWTAAVGDAVLAAVTALRAEVPVAVRLGQAQAPLGQSVNRRLAWPWPSLTRHGLQSAGVRMAPNPKGPRADVARVAVLSDTEALPIALIWSWACHPTSPLARQAVSSDYPGAVRAALRDAFGPVPILFLQGFAGDVRPPGRPASRLEDLASLLRGPRFQPMGAAGLALWDARLSGAVIDLARAAAATRARLLTGRVRASSRPLPLGAFLMGAPDRAMGVGRLQLGDALGFVHLEAEPCAEHLAAVAGRFPDAWPVGYADDVFGYLPTDAQVPEGGYEVDGYMPLFAMRGRYRGSIDAALDQTLEGLQA
jgi:hypothetical protein